jgi:glycosyltransferase involved in cell wall biosynthesis
VVVVKLEPQEILFLGIGDSAVCWYRCALPAMNLGADWCGVIGAPPGLGIQTGIVKHDTKLPNYDDYKVVVMQQPQGQKWLKLIRSLQARGIKVIYEVDDYLHAVSKQRGHDFAKHYSKEALRGFELCMRVCDGMICSTEYLARRYRKFNANTYVCRNGLDVARYNLTRPERPTVNIGWAGATGHQETLVRWMNEVVLPVLASHDNTCFVSVGNVGVARAIQPIVGEHRSIGTPFMPLENYPAAMAMMDIALGPVGGGNWYRAKSDLRWLEAAALGIPIIADASVYSEIETGRTGWKVSDLPEARERLVEAVENAELRRRVGDSARAHVRHQRDAATASLQWLDTCRRVAGDDESAPVLLEP